MRLEFHGAVRVVTGSCYLLRLGERDVLFECGMYQGPASLERHNREPFFFDPRRLAAVVVTHAHIDHIGLLPKLVNEGFTGPIHATGTVDLAKLLLLDAAHIAESDAEHQNRKAKRAGRRLIEPLYTVADAERANQLFVGHSYGDEVPIMDGLRVRYRDAGHILGSAFVEATVAENGKQRRVTFSGDIGNSGQAIIRDPEPPAPTDALLIESTYGDRLHKSRPDTLNELAAILQAAHRDGGHVVIPAFAVGRTQEILYRLRELAEQGELPPFRVFVDSPLAISATDVVREHRDCYDGSEAAIQRLAQNGTDPLAPPRLEFTREVEQSRQINFVKEPSVIISANGMCSAGRILHHLKHNLWRRESHIVFTGYQAEGTLGRLLVNGAPRVRIMGEEIAVAAHIHTIGGLSAHADRDGLLRWMEPLAANRPATYVVHGEEDAAAAFARAVQRQYGYQPVVPMWHEHVTL
jgi:metallo-beta-lactamase family protein